MRCDHGYSTWAEANPGHRLVRDMQRDAGLVRLLHFAAWLAKRESEESANRVEKGNQEP